MTTADIVVAIAGLVVSVATSGVAIGLWRKLAAAFATSGDGTTPSKWVVEVRRRDDPTELEQLAAERAARLAAEKRADDSLCRERLALSQAESCRAHADSWRGQLDTAREVREAVEMENTRLRAQLAKREQQ